MFEKHITEFNNSIIGLRDFVDLIDPFLTEKRQEHEKQVSPLILSGLLNHALSDKSILKKDEIERYEELLEQSEKKISELYKNPVDVFVEKEENEDQKVFVVKVRTNDNPEISTHINNVEKSKSHIQLLYKNSLLSLMSSVEWFFSQILHFYYDRFPSSAGIQNKSMTLADIKTFDSIEVAEKHLIDLKIEEILRGNFESWLNLLQNDFNLKLGYLKDVQSKLIEIYQRRNILTHNGGVVNSIYLSKVDEQFKTDLRIGEVLSVDKEYLDNAICLLQKSFLLIAAELWKKLDNSDKNRGEIFTDIIYENLLKSRWEICEGLSYFLMNDSKMDPVIKVIAKLNNWLSQKRLGKYESIKAELENTDYTDKKEIFQLGLLALKEEFDTFFEILPSALDSNQLNIERLEEFPIFKEVRETDLYTKFKKTSKHFKKPNQKVKRLKSTNK